MFLLGSIQVVLLLGVVVFGAHQPGLGTEYSTRPTGFVNHGVTNRMWGTATAVKQYLASPDPDQFVAPPFPVDKMGWPMKDCQGVIFDDRTPFAWAPPPDDPEKSQPAESGTYKLQLTGAAEISVGDQCKNIKVQNQKYDASTNTMTADVILEKGPDLMTLEFKNTRREANGKNNTGFTNLIINFPGYPLGTKQLVTNNLIKAIQPFNHVRFMGYLGTNYVPWIGKTVQSSIIEWHSRPLPGMAIYGDRTICRGCNGYPWEWVVEIANTINKDIWINIPVTASSPNFRGENTPKDDTQTYVYQIANLLKHGNSYTANKGLKDNLNVYVEHSNEVWNFGFGQYAYNKAAAQQQVDDWKECPLNATGVPGVQLNSQTWATRRHLQALYNITQIFNKVLGKQRVRPIYAWWFAGFSLGIPAMNQTLQWFEHVYKQKASDVFWGVSAAHYFGGTCDTGGIDQCLKDYRNASMQNVALTKQTAAVARQFGLKYTAYEAGPGFKVGDKTNLANHIEANRAPGMAPLIKLDVEDNFWNIGGDVYNYFALSSAYSRFGCWGATDDLANLTTVKYQEVKRIVGGKR